MMAKPIEMNIDIQEDYLKERYPESLKLLLKDHTTQENIYWATDSYAERGSGYGFFDPITIEAITGANGDIIRPRVIKSQAEQARRVKDKAEVFTPSWVCNAQNNLVDEAWFGRSDVFNRPDPDNPQKWIDTEGEIAFPNTDGKTWKDYVVARRLEITCGEAPYLVSRYDTVSGETIDDVRHRIGLLDRKLIVVSQHIHKSGDWITWAKIALRATYGFEWQGDNLLLAREALFFTFMEYYEAKFGKKPPANVMDGVAYIVSWNVWQMDGLKYGLPGYEPVEMTNEEINQFKKAQAMSLFPEEIPDLIEPRKRLCRIKDFIGRRNIHRENLCNGDFSDRDAKQQKFLDVINENKIKRTKKSK